jgi:sarcosine oxidase
MAGFDVAVVGLGAIGSAALSALACRGLRVVGVERFAPGHDRGSSHGATRIIRLGYFEHPSYVPLVRESYRLWRELEARSAERLLHVTGIVEIGAPDGQLVPGTLQSLRLHALPHDVLDAADVMQRWSVFRIPSHYVGVYQPDGGFLLAEAAIHAQIKLATRAGAEIRTGETVCRIESCRSGARVETNRGTIDARAAIVAAGPWLNTLVPDLPMSLRVTRQVMGWFEPAEAARFSPDRFPVFILESRHGMHYGFPLDDAARVKIAKHHHGDEEVDPDNYDRVVSAQDESLIHSALAEHLPDANGRLLAAKTCLYTNTPDGDFILEHLASHPGLIIASPCSGHGFKFAPVIGEILADLATTGTTRHDITRFRLPRFR